MSVPDKVSRFLRTALRVLFKDDIRLLWRGKKVRLVTQSTIDATRDRKKAESEAARQREHDELVLLQRELGGLLSEPPQTRRRCRHLAFVEHAIERKGLRAVHEMPLDVLRPALEQLESLVINWSPQGLANLRSKMAVVIAVRERADSATHADAQHTALPLEALQGPTPAPSAKAVAADDPILAAVHTALDRPGDRPPAVPAATAAQRAGSRATLPAGEQPASRDTPPHLSLLPLQLPGESAVPSGPAQAARRTPDSPPEFELVPMQD